MAQVKITHHTVQENETLMDLARRYYNDPSKYRDIFLHNAGVFVGKDRETSAIALEVNFTTGKLWVAVNAGDWNNSATANPTTGDEGIDISTTASEFTRAVSTDFSPWN